LLTNRMKKSPMDSVPTTQDSPVLQDDARAPLTDAATADKASALAQMGQARGGIADKSLPLVRIQPEEGWVSLRLGELWRYRELLYFLTWRDVKVRYKQTILGASWAIIQPFFTMVVFSLFFGRLARIPSDGIPYPIFSYAALVPWTFFANGLAQSSNSLVASSNLIKKVYFPRLVVPVSTVISGLVDFLLAFSVLLLMILFYGISPFNRPIEVPWLLPPDVALMPLVFGLTLNVLWLPLFLFMAFITSLGVGLWLSAMNVQFRDVRYLVPFLTQIWMFATPIAYPSSLLSEPWRTLYGINPMAGVVEGFRWALLGADTAPGPIILVSAVVSLVLLVSGAFYFRRMEKTFADVV
jgi:lipopolysaccharide transport system permease protein